MVMIKMNFVNGSRMREVIVRDRIVMFKPEFHGIPPLQIDLDKIKDTPQFDKLTEEEKELLDKIRLLNTEEEKAKDIKKDFQRSGWRMFNIT